MFSVHVLLLLLFLSAAHYQPKYLQIEQILDFEIVEQNLVSSDKSERMPNAAN